MVCCALLGLVVNSFDVATSDGAKIFVNACSTCHTATRQSLDNTRLARDEWNEAVERMISYGAEIPKGKLRDLMDYIIKTHGPAGPDTEASK